MLKVRFCRFLILVAALTIASSCGQSTDPTPAPNIQVADSTSPNNDHRLTFGSVQQNDSMDQTVTITNIGTADLVIGNVAGMNPLAAPFSITDDSCSGRTIPSSGTCMLTVRFEPSTINVFNDSFDIPSNDPDTPTVTITVFGTGTAIPVPNIVMTDSVTPDNDLQIPFESVVQDRSKDHTVTIANTGTANLVIGTIASANPLAAPFSIMADACSGQTLTPSGTCSLTVRFAPLTPGSFSDDVHIPSNDPDIPSLAVSLSGTGITPQMGGAILGNELDLENTVSTVAGSSPLGYIDGPAMSAKFYAPYGITTDGTNLYVTDGANYAIRQINMSTGAVTTFAGGPAAPISAYYITTDGENVYFTYNHCIRKINISTGALTTFAGQVGGIGGSDDGTGTDARFRQPYGITTDGVNLYVADTYNNTIRQIVISTGVVTTLAGTAGSSGSADGFGAGARFTTPFGITTDGQGNLYVADTRNYTIRQIVIATGEVTTIAGLAGSYGAADGMGAAARFRSSRGITTDGTNLYVTDYYNHTIRQIDIATRVVTTLAGTALSPGSVDGTGADARFNYPAGIVNYGANLYVADAGNHIIRKIVISTGHVTGFAGAVDSAGSLDGTGAASRFNYPSGAATDGTNLYLADTNNHTIRKIVIATGAVATVAGAAGSSGSDDGTGASAKFSGPRGITTDGVSLFVADTDNHTIRQIDISTGAVTTLAGTAGTSGTTDGIGTDARFNKPYGITTDGTNLYVSDTYNQMIRKIVIATRDVTTLAGTWSSGYADGIGTAARLRGPDGITTDGTNLYVADTYNHAIRRIVIATRAVTTLAGTAGSSGGLDGVGAAARFDEPSGITTDGTNLYVVNRGNHIIRKIDIATRAVTTIAGAALTRGSADGTGADARFNTPYGITTDGVSLYVTDALNNTIRRIQ